MTMGAAQKLHWHDPLHAEALLESSVGTTPCAQRRSPLLVILACLVPSIRKDPIDTNFRERSKSSVGTTSCLQREEAPVARVHGMPQQQQAQGMHHCLKSVGADARAPSARPLASRGGPRKPRDGTPHKVHVVTEAGMMSGFGGRAASLLPANGKQCVGNTDDRSSLFWGPEGTLTPAIK